MELAMIGLGRMGANMAERLVRGGHAVRGYDPGDAARQQAEARGIVPHANLQNAVSALPSPRSPRWTVTGRCTRWSARSSASPTSPTWWVVRSAVGVEAMPSMMR